MAYARTGIPATETTVFYSHTILLNGVEVGTLQKLTVSQSRTVERIREVHAKRGPEVRELVWGGTDVEVDLDRVELYTASLTEALGLTNIYWLDDINFVFDIIEVQTKPADGQSGAVNLNMQAAGNKRYICYKDCVPQSLSKTIDLGSVKIVETMKCFVRTVEVSVK